MIRILIADDHGIVRTGLKLLLERVPDMEVVGEASDGREAVRLAKELRPDIIVMDIGMPLLNGLDAAGQIIRENEGIGIIILSMYADESYIVRALDAGVCDGVISGVAGVLPELMQFLYFERGSSNYAEVARNLDELIDHLGVFPTPWGLKLIAELRGLATANFSQPVSPQRQSQATDFRAWFARQRDTGDRFLSSVQSHQG